MTNEERAEQEHALGLWIANVNNNVLGLQHWAQSLETAVKIGAYDAVDAPALAELIYLEIFSRQRLRRVHSSGRHDLARQ